MRIIRKIVNVIIEIPNFPFIMMGVILFEILNTYSRGAYLALIIVLLLIFFELKLNPLFLLASIGFGFLFLFVAPTDYLERFESLSVLSPTDEYGIYEDSALRGRSSEILTGLEMFLDKPILGVGAGNYENNYQKYAQDIGIELRLEERQPHSLYVQILSETGILGCAMFAGLVLTLMIGLNNARKSIGSGEKLGNAYNINPICNHIVLNYQLVLTRCIHSLLLDIYRPSNFLHSINGENC